MTDIVEGIVEEQEQTLVALSPAEMVPAQHALIAWADRKVKALDVEFKELEEHLHIARANGWKASAATSALNRTARRITYYQNMKVALEAGYLLVPNMPVNVLAVRVKRGKQPEKQDTWNHQSLHTATPQQALPAGQGRYVDNNVEVRGRSYQEEENGKIVTKKMYYSGEYDEEVDFPITLMKPVVLEAAAQAMALKVFDQIGVVQNERTGRDPFLVGQLLDPRGNGRMTTFYIAWWVSTQDL